MYWYNSRWYDASLGRWAQPDSIIPNPYNPQSWDRFGYVLNNPVRYNDPSGHLNEQNGGGAGGVCDYICQSGLRRDQLIQWVLEGSGENGTWNAEDSEFYYANKDNIWAEVSKWKNKESSEWNGFADHAERLASHYTPEEEDKFIRDFALVFGGVPIGLTWDEAAVSVALGPGQFTPLGESNTGLRQEFIDSDDGLQSQSHHYAGILFLGYYMGSPFANFFSAAREVDTLNFGDIRLGEAAIRDGQYFRSQGGSYQDFVDRIRALAVSVDQ